MTPRHKGLISAHIAAVFFGLTGVFGHVIHASPMTITFGRALFAVLALYGVARYLRTSLVRGLDRRSCLSLVCSGVALTVHWVTFFMAVKTGGIAIATLGFASFPAFITLLERVVLKDQVNMVDWVLVALVMSGLILVTPAIDLNNAGTIGLFWGVLSAITFATLALINRSLARLNAIQIAFCQNLIVLALCLPLGLGGMAMLSDSSLLWLIVLGVICTALSHFLFVHSLRSIPARSAGLIIALEPVYAIAFALVLFNEQPTLKMALGAVLIIAAAICPRKQTGHAT
ncbi:DMT family transporter [Advenella mimigardefordensis]|uniref:Putative membrane protein, EamA family n=1 Tax=Advenella mimigardefordensis (strain DSM 17166 / LMG 22922 / DPN7) TaxID=1247726 RepID=W0P801_ADVMD|nr:DMT family transporter [Advenella mimigardefordensis]AHG62989.1 putative membrane protein, EamA family [Advenella mimigardefordensis DPN7]